MFLIYSCASSLSCSVCLLLCAHPYAFMMRTSIVVFLYDKMDKWYDGG